MLVTLVVLVFVAAALAGDVSPECAPLPSGAHFYSILDQGSVANTGQ
jgi:hypothetical protein